MFVPTGETRVPARGEWFVNEYGYPTRAYCIEYETPIYRPWSEAGESGGDELAKAKAEITRLRGELLKCNNRYMEDQRKQFIERDQLTKAAEFLTAERDSLRQQLSAVQVKPGDVVLRKVGENIRAQAKQAYFTNEYSPGKYVVCTQETNNEYPAVYDVIRVPPVPPSGETAKPSREWLEKMADAEDACPGGVMAANPDHLSPAPEPIPVGTGGRPQIDPDLNRHATLTYWAEQFSRFAKALGVYNDGIYCFDDIHKAIVLLNLRARPESVARTETLEGLLREAGDWIDELTANPLARKLVARIDAALAHTEKETNPKESE